MHSEMCAVRGAQILHVDIFNPFLDNGRLTATKQHAWSHQKLKPYTTAAYLKYQWHRLVQEHEIFTLQHLNHRKGFCSLSHINIFTIKAKP